MPSHPLAVTLAESRAPRPVPPDSIDPLAWIYYYDDLACWIATRADRFQYGIKDDEYENS